MKKIIIPIAALAAISGTFYGGMKYAQSQSPRMNFGNLSEEQRQQFRNSGGSGGTFIMRGNGMRGNMGGEFTAGEIIAKDDKTITIKLRDGGSKIVFFTESTPINKTVPGTFADLENGKFVTISGKANTDGTITAQNIDLRAAPLLTPETK